MTDSAQPARPAADPGLNVTAIDGGTPMVVFLHGLFGQGKNFTSIAKALAPEHGSLLVDLPNHGGSGWTDRVDYGEMADAVAAAVRDRLPGGPVCVVGHSMGGKVAMVLALQHPDLVDRLVVVDIAPAGTGEMSEFEYYLDTLGSLDLSGIGNRTDADEALRAAIPNNRVRGFLLQNLRRGSEGWYWQANLAVLRRDLPAIGGFDHAARVPAYDGPVLWVIGGESPYVRPEHDAVMRELFPKARKVTVKDAGHWVHSEDPETFISLLRAFLAHPARAAG